MVGRNLAHFTAFDAFEAAFAGFFAQEAAAHGRDTSRVSTVSSVLFCSVLLLRPTRNKIILTKR